MSAKDDATTGLPNHEHVTLTEALMWLATGSAKGLVTPEVTERAERIEQLVRAVLAERAADEAFADFPASLPSAPATDLVEALDACRKDWPPSADRLYEEAKVLADDQQARVTACDAAWARLQEAACAGSIHLSRRPDGFAAHNQVAINSRYFDEPLDYLITEGRNEILPSEPTLGPNPVPAYRDVRVNRADLLRVFGGANRQATRKRATPKRDTAMAAIRACYPDGINVDLKTRYASVERWCKSQDPPIPVPSESTVKRAEKRLKKSGGA